MVGYILAYMTKIYLIFLDKNQKWDLLESEKEPGVK